MRRQWAGATLGLVIVAGCGTGIGDSASETASRFHAQYWPETTYEFTNVFEPPAGLNFDRQYAQGHFHVWERGGKIIRICRTQPSTLCINMNTSRDDVPIDGQLLGLIQMERALEGEECVPHAQAEDKYVAALRKLMTEELGSGCFKLGATSLGMTPSAALDPDANPTTKIPQSSGSGPKAKPLPKLLVPAEARGDLVRYQNLLTTGMGKAEAKAAVVKGLAAKGISEDVLNRAIQRLNTSPRGAAVQDWADFLQKNPDAVLKPEAIDWTK